MIKTKQQEQQNAKHTSEFLLCCPSTVLKCGLCNQSEPTGENIICLCEGLSTGDTFLIKRGGLCPLSVLGPHLASWTCLCMLHSLCEFICTSALLYLEGLFSCCFPSPLTLIIFLPPGPQRNPQTPGYCHSY